MKEYRCDCCKLEFEDVLTDEEVITEFNQRFPDYPYTPGEDVSIVCDSCYQQIMKKVSS
jgi:hypothetical protein